MPFSLEIRHCRALIAVAEHGSVGRAAASLGMAQSTLSETLIALERAVGARMVVRRRGMEARLTPAAHILLPHGRQIVAAAETASALMAAEAKILRVGAVESISSYLLPAAIRNLRGSHPEVQVQVTTGLCADLRGQVVSGRLDVAMLLSGTRSVAPDMLIRTLGTSPLRLVAGRNGGLAGKRLDQAALQRLDLLVPDPYGPLNELLDGWTSGSSLPGRFVSAGSLDGVKQGSMARGAAGLLPAYAVDHEIAARRLTAVEPEVALPSLILEAAMSPVSAQIEPLEALLRGIFLRPGTASKSVYEPEIA